MVEVTRLKIKVRDREIGPGNPCFIIAEAGINHNGDINLAKTLVDVAADAGADAVKFQTFISEDLVTRDLGTVKYQMENLGVETTQFDMLKSLELSLDEFKDLKKYCDEKEIIFLSTLHSNSKVLDFMGVFLPAFKVGSGDLNNLPFLEEIAKRKKPIILGTGMSTMEEIKEAIDLIKTYNNEEIIILHATTNYPCPLEEVNLNAMKTLRSELDCLVGYSDHTEGITVPIMAVSLGAVVLEKHFTLNKTLPGPDHKASLNPQELKRMVAEIRNVEKALGSSEKKPVNSELDILTKIRKSLVANMDIKKGTKITRKMIAIKRPGTGLSPKNFNLIIGKIINRDIRKDQLLRDDMFD